MKYLLTSLKVRENNWILNISLSMLDDKINIKNNKNEYIWSRKYGFIRAMTHLKCNTTV